MQSNNWYVITGAPHSGKTAVINLLKAKGFEISEESAREYIDEQLSKGISLEEMRSDEIYFQEKILERKIEAEKKLPKDKIVFLDRGIPDSLAYYQSAKANPKQLDYLKKAVEKSRYKKVFLLSPLPYQKDYARAEDEAEQIKLYQLLKTSYSNLPYPLIEVKSLNNNERIDFILSQI